MGDYNQVTNVLLGLPLRIMAHVNKSSMQITRTAYIVYPLDSGPELSKTEVDLDVEDDGPVRLPILALLRLRASRQWREIRAYVAQRREIVCTW